MNKYVLSICIPTYNRSKTLVPFIKNYLNCKDSRFCITVQDNCSTDGSYEALSKITDSRFVLRQNTSNIGGMPNAKCALANNIEAEYLLFCIDKDFVDMKRISDFIDFLEAERPAYGYLDLYKLKPDCIEKYPEGIKALIKTGYLSKHPSGYFWRRELFEEEITKPYFKALPFKFDFWFDFLCAHFAVKFQGYIVYMPVVLHGQQNPYSIPNKSICYNEHNIYFSLNKQIETFNIYICDLKELSLSIKDKRNMALRLFKRQILSSSIGLRKKYHNRSLCWHYNLQTKTVSWREMFVNSLYVASTYRKLMRGFENVLIVFIKSIILLGYTTSKFSIISIKESLSQKK